MCDFRFCLGIHVRLKKICRTRTGNSNHVGAGRRRRSIAFSGVSWGVEMMKDQCATLNFYPLQTSDPRAMTYGVCDACGRTLNATGLWQVTPTGTFCGSCAASRLPQRTWQGFVCVCV